MCCSLCAILIKHIYEQAKNHDDAPRPKQYTLIPRPSPNQSTTNLLNPLTNTQRHHLMCKSRQSIKYCLPNSHQHQRQWKIYMSISEAALRPFSSCGGTTNLLLRSAFLRSIIIRIRDCRIGMVKIQPKGGEISCFSVFECSRYMTTSPMYCKMM
jgi:hypothetical protein